MDRTLFHKTFKCMGVAVIPVICVLNEEQTFKNLQIAMQEGAQGVFLINHDFGYKQLLPILVKLRNAYPSVWMGVNFIDINARDSFKTLGSLSQQGCILDGYWTDNAEINERVSQSEQNDAYAIEAARKASGWNGLYFGGTAFKYQRYVPNDALDKAAEYASEYMDVVTTSASGTAGAAILDRITIMRNAISDKALALASGVTPENAPSYVPHVDCFLVATGVSSNPRHFDPIRMRALVQKARGDPVFISIPETTGAWYLQLIAPTTGSNTISDSGSSTDHHEMIATPLSLDPSRLYQHASAFAAAVKDIATPIQLRSLRVDMVVCISASSVPLAAGVALKLETGLVPLAVGAADQDIEPQLVTLVTKTAIQPKAKVIIIDVVLEKVKAVNSAIELVKKNGGTVVALAAIFVKKNPETDTLCQEYPTFHVTHYLTN